jgi:hypothetical protein
VAYIKKRPKKQSKMDPIEIMVSPLESARGVLVTAEARDENGALESAQKHMAEMEARYDGLLEASADPMVVVDEAGILTTSAADADVERSYQLHGNCYLCKPVQLYSFENLVRGTNDFWLTKARLPQQWQAV